MVGQEPTIDADGPLISRQAQERQCHGPAHWHHPGSQAVLDHAIVAKIGQYRSRAKSFSRVKLAVPAWLAWARQSWPPGDERRYIVPNVALLSGAIGDACERTAEAVPASPSQ